MSAAVGSVRRRAGAVGAAAAWLGAALLLGCATPAPPSEPEAAAPRPRVHTPELDFLIARQLELEGRLAESLEAYRSAVEQDPDAPYLHRKIAQLAARQGNLSEAISHARRAHELDPDDVDTRLLLGTLYRVRKQTDAAEALLRDAEGQPLGTDAAWLLYTLYIEAERYEEALAAARWIVDEDAESLRGWLALHGAYERLGQPEEAEGALRAALDRQPGNLALYGALARSRRARGDREGEIAVYREVLERYPHHHSTLTSLADALIAQGRRDEAVEALKDVVRYHPEDVRSAARLSLLEYDMGRYESAARRLEGALAGSPEEYELAYLLGLVRQRHGEDDAALEAFGRVPADHRHYVDARTQMAVVLEEREAYEEALEQVRRALAVRSSRPLELYEASLLAKVGRFDEAVASLEAMLAGSPDDDELLYNLGVLHGEAGHYDEALRYMQLALEKNPDNPSALNYVGYTWAERGENLDQAEAYITRALELRPDDGFITDSLGWVYYMRARPLMRSDAAHELEQGRALLRRALAELERAVELTGGDPVIAEHLGDVYLLLDDKQRALKHYEDAIRSDPREDEQPELRRKFERLRRELEGP